MAVAVKDIRAAARQGFGYHRLRAGQQEAIAALAEGRDVVAVMPTGFGKSAIYQVAGLLVDGPTVVVSPLIALQHDQVATIIEDGAGGAAVANSTLSAGARRAALDEVGEGNVEFLFLAPEQFANADTMGALRANPPSLFVVDEAHCISAWGHDFRPSYLHLAPVLAELGHPRVLALTATAAPPVREEIVARLGLDDPLVIVKGFDRPNISLVVERHADGRRRDEALLSAAAAAPKPSIVYAATRRRAEELGAALAARGVATGVYHGGLAARRRAEVQDRFMAGDLEVIAATNAFGLGIDKADVRFVLHAEPPESLDAYYQEVGRAGRDGEPAEAVLFWRAEDLGMRRFFATGPRLERPELERVARAAVEAGPAGLLLVALADAAGLRPGRAAAAVGWLAREGAVAVGPGGEPVRATGAVSPEAAGKAAAAAAAARRRLDQSRVEMVRSYAESRGCRRQLLLGYFGEPFQPPCGACDNCRRGAAPPAGGHGPFAVGDRVAHRSLGEGTVTGVEDGKLVVLFEDRGYATLDAGHVVAEGLLSVVGQARG